MNVFDHGNGPVFESEDFKIVPIGAPPENPQDLRFCKQLDVIFKDADKIAFRFIWKDYEDKWELFERIPEWQIPTNKIHLGSNHWRNIGYMTGEETADPMCFVNAILDVTEF